MSQRDPGIIWLLLCPRAMVIYKKENKTGLLHEQLLIAKVKLQSKVTLF